MEIFSIKNKKMILLYLCILILCIQTIITIFFANQLPILVIIFSFITLISYCFTIYYNFIQINKLQIISQDLENTKKYNETLSSLYDNVKSFKHDFYNIVLIIGGFINNNDIDGLKKYYDGLEKDCQRVNNIALLNPKVINNAGIYNLLMKKYQKAINMGIKVNFEIFFDFNKLQMPIYDFSRILGILLDNAIEASSETIEKKINITFRNSLNTNTQTIIIENSYSNKNIDKNKIFEKGVSEKENHLGMGLWEVKQLVNKNTNVELTTDTTPNYFIQNLKINYLS